MEKTQRSETKQIAMLRSHKWAAGAAAMLLSASLVLSACGGSSEPVVSTDGAGTSATSTASTPADTTSGTTPEAGATTAITPEADATTGTTPEAGSATDTTPEAGSTPEAAATESATPMASEEMTGTEGVSGSESMTGTGAASDNMPAMGVVGIDNQYVRASTLLDYDFENMGGEVSGDLEDLLIDLSTGRVLFASIEYGGVLDLGDKDIVVPLNAFTVGSEGELVLNIDETSLENYPDVGNDWPDLNDPQWDDDVNTFWGDNGIQMGQGFETPSTSVARVSDILGRNTADLGSGAGSILDVLVNLGSAQASYLIVDSGEGLDSDPYIIPLAAFDMTNWSNEEDEFVYGPDFTPDLLTNAPRFDQDQYPEGSPLDSNFGDSIESAWNDMGFSNDLNGDGEND